jgi:hypothetical protein
MTNDDHRLRITELHDLVATSSNSGSWAREIDSIENWQSDVLTRILALTIDQDIQYLSSAKLDDEDWDFVAFTEKRVVRVLVTAAGGTSVRLETTTFARDTLESLELLDVGAIPTNETPWPADLNLIGHYHSASIPLPLDKFASTGNKLELVHLLRSLLQDAAH